MTNLNIRAKKRDKIKKTLSNKQTKRWSMRGSEQSLTRKQES